MLTKYIYILSCKLVYKVSWSMDKKTHYHAFQVIKEINYWKMVENLKLVEQKQDLSSLMLSLQALITQQCLLDLVSVTNPSLNTGLLYFMNM